MEFSDAAAVAQARVGDTEAFRVLVERHSRNVFRLAYRMTGNEPDAEDVVQETFLRAFRQLHQFDSRASFGTWIHRIAANYALDMLRSKKRRAELVVVGSPQDDGAGGAEAVAAVPASDPAPDRLAFGSEVQRLLEPALRRLSDLERSAFVLRHYEGLCMEEIGEILGVQANAAKQSVFRAVQKLRRALEPAVSSSR